MRWQQAYGKDLAFFLHVERRQRKPIKPLTELPTLTPEQDRIAQAYAVLSNSRDERGGIRLTDALAYCELYGVPSESRGSLVNTLSRINIGVMAAEQRERKSGADDQPKSEHRQHRSQGRRR